MDDASGNAAPGPWDRYGDAVRVFEDWLARRRSGVAESEAELLATHPHLHDLLSAMLPLAGSLAERLERAEPVDPVRSDGAPLPRTIGKYDILERLDSGGMGRVFRARAPGILREVALKIPIDAFPSATERLRFEREAQVGARLDHPNICRVFDYGIDGETPFLVMQLVAGRSLKRVLGDETRTPPTDERAIRDVARFVEQLAATIHYAHEHGVVHRDLKPGNVMMTPAGQPVVLDLGLVRTADSSDTLSGELLGTAAYMSPEQVDGRRVWAAADVWALGTILYECLTHRPAFSGPSPAAIYRQIREQEPTPLRRWNPKVPTELCVIVATALRKNADDRYASAADLAEDLRRFRERLPILAKPASPVLVAWRRCQRHPLVASLLAALVLALVAVGFGAHSAVLAAERADHSAVDAGRQAARANRAEAETTRRIGDELFRSGMWAEAIDAYDRALTSGAADEVAILIRKAEALEGLLQFAASRELVDGLAARDDLGQHRGKVLLLRGDRTRDPESKFRPDRNIDPELLRAALGTGGLHASDAAYVEALLAEEVQEIRRHLETALAARPWHRPANEMYLSTLLLTGDVAEARIAAATYQGLFPDDAFGTFLSIVALAAAGEFERAGDRLEIADPDADGEDAPGVRAARSIVAALRAFQRIPGLITDQVACQALGEPRPPVARHAAVALELAAAGLASGADITAVMEPFPRVHPTVLASWYGIFASVMRLFAAHDPEGFEDWAGPILERMPEAMVFYVRGFARLVRREHVGASDDFFEAAERGSMIAPRRSALLLGFVATSRIGAADQGRESTARRARAAAALHDILAMPDLSDREYRLVAAAAAAFLPPERAQEVELARRRRHPCR